MGERVVLRDGMTLFYLERGSLTGEEIKECAVRWVREKGCFEIEEKEKDYLALRFEMKQKDLNDMWDIYQRVLFKSREEAEKKLNQEFEAWKARLMSMTKEELLQKFYREWVGEHGKYANEERVMKEKIKMEFGVDLEKSEGK